MTYEEMARRWLALAQRNASGATRSCTDMLKGEGRLLCLLLEQDGGMSAGEIGSVTGITTGRVANLLKSLEAKGLISRSHDTDDRRKTIVKLTDAGRKQAESIRDQNVEREAGVLKSLGRDDASELLRLFERYIDAKEEIG